MDARPTARATATPPTPAPASPTPVTPARPRISAAGLLFYLAAGIAFGFVLTKSEAISWFRIQEMFRFQSFHMYGILFSAVAVATAGVALIRRLGLRSAEGRPIVIARKEFRGRNYRYWIGGSIFGLGWALLGACPGPIYALIGNGIWAYAPALLAALAGTWAYGWLRPRLPHY